MRARSLSRLLIKDFFGKRGDIRRVEVDEIHSNEKCNSRYIIDYANFMVYFVARIITSTQAKSFSAAC